MKIKSFGFDFIVAGALLISPDSTAIAQQNTSKLESPKRVRWALVLSGKIEDVKKALGEGGAYNLVIFTGDATLKILKIQKLDANSVQLSVEGARSFEDVKALYERGGFEALMGEEIEVLAVKAANNIKSGKKLRRRTGRPSARLYVALSRGVTAPALKSQIASNAECCFEKAKQQRW
jgi:hypothetical protein